MPRNGAGVYSLPAGSTVTDNVDDILAAQHNTPLLDLQADMNTVRPIVAGGTGASSVSAARTAFGLGTGDTVKFDALRVGQSTTDTPGVGNTTVGAGIGSGGRGAFSSSGQAAADMNRNASDGSLVNFRRDGDVVGGVNVTATTLTATSIGAMIFEASSVEAMRLTSTSARLWQSTTDTPGNGNNTPGASVTAAGQINASISAAAALSLNRYTSDGPIAIFRGGSASWGNITVSAGAVTYNSTSDYRMKEAIETPASHDPIRDIKALAGVLRHYVWKDIPDAGPQFGAFAHEVQEVISGVATGEKDAVEESGEMVLQGVDWSKAVPTIVAALASVLAENEQLKARVASLEAK